MDVRLFPRKKITSSPQINKGPSRSRLPKVKKLDNIINALETPAVEASVADSTRRLESIKKTREGLITDPNSKAHLRVGKLKAARKRAGFLARGDPGREVRRGEGGSESGGGAGGIRVSAAAASGGLQLIAPSESVAWSNGGSPRLAHSTSAGSGGMDGLLEAAASLSDGEIPGTPTRNQPDSLRDRSPRISGCIAPHGGDGVGAGAWAGPAPLSHGGGMWDAAAALGALKPGGAFTAVVGPRPMRPVPHNAVTGALEGHAPGGSFALGSGSSGGIDIDIYAAAMASFVRPPGAAVPLDLAAGAAAGAHSCAVLPGASPQIGIHPQLAAMGGLNPHMAQMLAWMAAMGGAAQQQAGVAQGGSLWANVQRQQQQPMLAAWNPFQHMAAAAGAYHPPPLAPLPPQRQQQHPQAVHLPPC